MDRLRLAKVSWWVEGMLWFTFALCLLRGITWVLDSVEFRQAPTPSVPLLSSLGLAWLVSGLRDWFLAAEIAQIRDRAPARLGPMRSAGKVSVFLGLIVLGVAAVVA